jgi:hypothetical protein
MKPFASALIGVACRISQPQYRHQLRCKLASINALRNVWHFAYSLRDELRRRPITQDRYAEWLLTRLRVWLGLGLRRLAEGLLGGKAKAGHRF